MSASVEQLSLTCKLHSSMQDLRWFDGERPFVVPSTLTVLSLMEEVESLIEQQAQARGEPVQFQINVIWNILDSKKALHPQQKLGDHFKSGDTFGVYGDCMAIPVERPKISEKDKMPVTILTGFLGSGKTTLLNYILEVQTEKKIAIIENEFGEVSIDDALLKNKTKKMAEKVVVMNNGCMCCTVRGDLIEGLKSILAEVKSGKHLDAVMIETTGMADPVPIVRTFMTCEDITCEMRLDGVLTVIDAKHILARLDDKIEEGKVNEAYQQVAFCDKMLLNKLDLVSADQAIVVKDRLREINSFAKICPAFKSRVKMSELTDMRAHDMVNFTSVDLEKEAEIEQGHGEGHGGGHGGHGEGHGGGHGEGHGGHGGHDENCTEEHGGGHGGGHGTGHGGGHGSGDGAGHGGGHGTGHGTGHETGHEPPAKRSRHDSRVNSFSIVKEGEILPQKLGKFMQTLGTLDAEYGVIFRIKAILSIKNHPYKHVFHAVMDVSDEEDAEEWGDEKRISKIVFIGKGLNGKFLRESFHEIFE